MSDSRAFPWAVELDADQLAAFIEDLWGAASGDSDLDTLAAIETIIAEHRPEDVQTAPCPLKERELDVLRRLANGQTYQSISAELHIALSTVRRTCTDIYHRIGATNQVQAAAIAGQQGWLPDLRTPRFSPELPGTKSPRAWQAYYRECVQQMREQPGVKVRIGPYGTYSGAHNAAWRINKGLLKEVQPAGAFSASAVVDGHGQWVVLGCYLGDPTDTTETTS
ncbi:LuxR C-terminal-related transcriptional regulator [Streptomyces sp. NPDC048415]|uniref:response regulator transcription factor n=1 Tax=Streptomyces sp. NPDC048415 TaxID=3154822 RepID=UPI00342E0120